MSRYCTGQHEVKGQGHWGLSLSCGGQCLEGTSYPSALLSSLFQPPGHSEPSVLAFVLMKPMKTTLTTWYFMSRMAPRRVHCFNKSQDTKHTGNYSDAAPHRWPQRAPTPPIMSPFNLTSAAHRTLKPGTRKLSWAGYLFPHAKSFGPGRADRGGG